MDIVLIENSKIGEVILHT